jgi:hypothetical protein
MATKTDLLAVWTKWTGDNVAEARQRIRALSEAGLLPRRKEPLGYGHLARALFGFTVADQHKDAPAAVRSFSSLRCSSHRFLGTPNDQAVLLAHRTLFGALVASLQPPLWVIALDVDTTSKICLLTVGQGYRETEKKGVVTDTQVEYTFGKDNSTRLRKQIHPIHLCRKIYSPLIGRLLTDLMNHPATAIPGSVAKDRPAKGDTSA